MGVVMDLVIGIPVNISLVSNYFIYYTTRWNQNKEHIKNNIFQFRLSKSVPCTIRIYYKEDVEYWICQFKRCFESQSFEWFFEFQSIKTLIKRINLLWKIIVRKKYSLLKQKGECGKCVPYFLRQLYWKNGESNRLNGLWSWSSVGSIRRGELFTRSLHTVPPATISHSTTFLVLFPESSFFFIF